MEKTSDTLRGLADSLDANFKRNCYGVAMNLVDITAGLLKRASDLNVPELGGPETRTMTPPPANESDPTPGYSRA